MKDLTHQMPPGGDVGGEALTDRGQGCNGGFGASRADLKRGHRKLDQPPTFEPIHPQRVRDMDLIDGTGFLNRSTIIDER